MGIDLQHFTTSRVQTWDWFLRSPCPMVSICLHGVTDSPPSRGKKHIHRLLQAAGNDSRPWSGCVWKCSTRLKGAILIREADNSQTVRFSPTSSIIPTPLHAFKQFVCRNDNLPKFIHVRAWCFVCKNHHFLWGPRVRKFDPFPCCDHRVVSVVIHCYVDFQEPKCRLWPCKQCGDLSNLALSGPPVLDA